MCVFGLHGASAAVWAFSICGPLAGAPVQLQRADFSLCWLSPGAQAPRHAGFRSCGAWAQQLQFWAPEQRLNSCGTQG